MASFAALDRIITEPDGTGRRAFACYLDCANFNDTFIGVGSSFLPWDFGKNILIRRITLVYLGTIGVDVYGYIGPGQTRATYLSHQVTTSTTDFIVWDVFTPINRNALTLWLYLVPVGYAATDDTQLIVEGEVW